VNDLPDDFTVDMVGYNPEIYVGEERVDGGLRVERDEWGRPAKPVFDVQPPQVEETSFVEKQRQEEEEEEAV
jgi:hypothetical protein